MCWIGGDEVRESSWEHIISVTHGAAALVNKFKFLQCKKGIIEELSSKISLP